MYKFLINSIVFLLCTMSTLVTGQSHDPCADICDKTTSTSQRAANIQTLCDTRGFNDSSADFIISTPTYSSSIFNGIVNHKKIVINSILFIDEDVSIRYSDLKMGDSGKIVLLSTKDLELRYCFVFSCTNSLWDGIIVPTNSVLTTYFSQIEDAEAAIIVDDGADLSLKGTIFNRNNVGITNANANGSANSFTFSDFFNNVFSCDSPLNGFSSTNYAKAGIELNQCVASIGNYGSVNTFKGARNGLLLTNSYVTVTNCVFEDFYIENNPINNGIGIDSKGGTLICDGNGQYFRDCGSRAITSDGTNLDIRNYDFLGNIRGAIISHGNENGVNINITDNFVKLDDNVWIVGLWVERGPSSLHYGQFNIENNIIELAHAATGHGEAISLYTPTSFDVGGIANIKNNDITIADSGNAIGINIDEGIVFYNQDNWRVLKNKIHFSGNIPAPGNTNLDNIAGIVMTGIQGTGSSISQNEITAHYNKPAWEGILISESTNVTVCSNKVHSTRNGIHFEGDCSGAQVSLNEFGRHSIGLLLTDCILGAQTRRGNTWSNGSQYSIMAAQNVGGNPNNSTFIVENSNIPLHPPSVTPGWFTVANGPSQLCRLVSRSSDRPNQTISVNEESQAEFSKNINQMNLAYQDAQSQIAPYLLEIEKENEMTSSLLKSLQNEDITVEQHDMIVEEVIKRKNNIATLLEERKNEQTVQMQLFLDKLSQIGAITDDEKSRKLFLELLALKSLGEDISNEALLAALNYSEEDIEKYTARRNRGLSMTCDCEKELTEFTKSSNNDSAIKNSQKQSFKIYPNPTNDFATITFEDDVSGTVDILHSSGKHIFTQPIESSDKVIIPVQNLGTGIYWVRVKTDENLISSQKLVITK